VDLQLKLPLVAVVAVVDLVALDKAAAQVVGQVLGTV
jgi:hypothetical protein